MSDPAAPEGTLATIARHLALAVRPLSAAVADLASFKTFMYRLGWRVQSLPPSYSALGTLVDEIVTAVKAIEASPDEPDPDAILALLDKVRALYQTIHTLADAPTGVDPAAFLAEIGERLFELLLVDYIGAVLPGLYHALTTVGVIAIETSPASGDRPPQVRTHLRYERIRDILSDPTQIPRFVYGWGTDDLDTTTLLAHLREVLDHTGALVSYGWAARDLVEAYSGGGMPRHALKLTAIQTVIADTPVEVAFLLLPLPAEDDHKPGLILQPAIPPGLAVDEDFGSGLSLHIRPTTDLSQLFGIVIRPGDLSVRYPFAPGTQLPAVGFGVSLQYKPEATTLLVGQPAASRLEMQGATASFDLDYREGGLEFRLGASLDGMKLTLAAGDQDSFLHKLIGDNDAAMPITLGMAWSSKTGFAFTGGAGLELSQSMNLTIGPLTIQELRIALRTTVGGGAPPDLIAEVGASIGGKIGPIGFSTQNMGLRFEARFQDGNAGPFDVSVGFKPPDGMGILIDAGSVTGGGFLSYDPAAGRYVGALELECYGIAVKAFGILDTKLPEDSRPIRSSSSCRRNSRRFRSASVSRSTGSAALRGLIAGSRSTPSATAWHRGRSTAFSFRTTRSRMHR